MYYWNLSIILLIYQRFSQFSGKKTVIHDIKGSDYCDYSNDDTITIATEGGLYDVLNNYTDYDSNLYDKFASLDFDGHYFEIGNAWNCSFYKL